MSEFEYCFETNQGLIMENGNCIPLSDCQLTGLTKWSEWTECSDDCLSPISTGIQRRQRIGPDFNKRNI